MPAGYHVELVLADENKIIEKVERADRLDVVFREEALAEVTSVGGLIAVLVAEVDAATS